MRFTQKGRALSVETPLGDDVLLLTKVSGTEAISEPFEFHLEMLAEAGTEVPFDKLLGQKATVMIVNEGVTRRISGIIREAAQGGRIAAAGVPLVSYRAELVPELWLLSRRTQSRVFQDQSVWQILETILKTEWGLSVSLRPPSGATPGTSAYPRNYCVQFQESDFAFVSRLMEEEGIAYYFPHTQGFDDLVIVEGGAAPDLPKPKRVPYRDSLQSSHTGPAVRTWEKRQSLRTGKHTTRDFHFGKPEQPIESQAARLAPEQVTVGNTTHTLNIQRRINEVDLLEGFDYPAGFAEVADGISSGGADQSAKLQDLYPEADRWARLRRDEEAAQALVIRGSSDFPHFCPGFRFELSEHFDADPNTPIGLILTRVEHEASIEGAYTSTGDVKAVYTNRFQCVPDGILYRPRRVTPRPRIDGYQTAIVVGPAGDEIFVDVFGRVKVKFHWDRRGGAGGPDSSCWLRVAQIWAGKGWGAFFWPRVGHEVVVLFEQGDPDRPLIVGSVYNAANLPPVVLTKEAERAGIKSCIFGGDPETKFNAIIFHDSPKIAHVQVQSERNALDHSEKTRIQSSSGTQYEFYGTV